VPSAIIMGGGLAGCATALALGRAGIEASVHERASGPADEVGAWLTLAGNGLDALAPLGLTADVTAVGFPTPTMALLSHAGREMVTFPSGAARADGHQAHTVRRTDLYRILRDECLRRGVDIRYGAELAAATPVPGGGVRARFTDGTETVGELLVGADGLRSRTRTIIDPAAAPARYTGLLNVGGYARGVDLGRPAGMLDFCFGRRCFLGYATAPRGDVWWFTNPLSADPARPPDGSEDAWRARLLDLFRDDGLPVRRLLEGSERLFTGWPTYDIPAVRTWHRDGMVLVGDAVHAASPSSGQGASLAFEDAVTLARCLRDRPSVAEAFAAYERLRRRRVEKVVERGKRTGAAKTPRPVGRWVRDRLVMPLFAAAVRRGGADRDAWLTGHHIDWDSPVPA
jgi:2-polyprenyl-6-methoxyphenol hydroxylase-like FAD-dependent oxidoreductase